MLKNKTVLITGTSRGIGKELCLAFLKNGASVIGLSSGKSINIFICFSDGVIEFVTIIFPPK